MKKFIVFAILFLSIAACNSEDDKSLFESALRFSKEQKFREAIQNYEKIISEFPESKYKAEVLFDLGKMYQARMDKNVAESDSYNKAKKYFMMLYKEFPKDKNAASSLFMVGFIQANLLNQLDSAKIVYNKFLKEFPNHPMAESAKAEVENLGVPPEQIIMKEKSAK